MRRQGLRYRKDTQGSLVLGVDLNLLIAELAFPLLGGQTTVNLTGSNEDAVKDAFGNISAYGSVA
jgi:hypothetical protein